MENKLSTISETYYDCERCGKPIPSAAVCNCRDKKYSEVELQQEIAKARIVNIGNAHEILMAYGNVCEEEGCLSDRAVTIRMDLAAYYSDQQLQTLKEHKEQQCLIAPLSK